MRLISAVFVCKARLAIIVASLATLLLGACGGGGGGGDSAPANPAGASGAGGGATAILEWNPNAEGDLAGYRIYRSTAAGSYGAPIASVPTGTTSYAAGGLQTGITYYFVVTAYDTSGNESPFSTEVSKVVF
jgi:hypothetical protein